MKVKNINDAEQEARRFLSKVRDLKNSEINGHRMTTNERATYPSKESAALKRSSMDLTRSLAKMRIQIY